MLYSGNLFNGFKLNVPDSTKKAAEYHVHIKIESDYKWGSGWTASQEKKFEDTIYPKLTQAGFIVNMAKDIFASETLTSSKNKLSLYLHPMEFTGYATPDDTKKIIDILNECKDVVYKTELLYCDPVYDISDKEYLKILEDNKARIIEHIKKNKDYQSLLWDAGFDFAKAARIPRIGDGPGYAGMDTDISFVSGVAHEIEQELQKEEDMER